MRQENPLHNVPRRDPEIPLSVSSEVLTNPKAKNTATFRKTMLRSRERIVELPQKPRKPYADRVATFARSRNIVQLSRCLRRYSKRVPIFVNWIESHPQEGLNFRQLQQRNAVEMALLDTRKHLEACETERTRRLELKPAPRA